MVRVAAVICLAFTVAGVAPARAEWKPANETVAAAARTPQIAQALQAVNRIDAALLSGDQAAFAGALASDLVVNNPQNNVSQSGATAQRGQAGLISYSTYERIIEYAGTRGDLVVLMGEERVTPKGDNPAAGKMQRRRFTDIWRPENGQWRLTVRQATLID